MEIVKFIFAAVFTLLGCILMLLALKKTKPEEDITGKNKPHFSGKGSKMHLFYLGLCSFIFAISLLFIK